MRTIPFLQRIRVCSGAQLKYIAFLSMVIDHTNKALIYPVLNGGSLLILSDIFDILGRIAFPIFVFLLVEGFFHTRSRKSYLLWMLGFGVISEIPYNMFSSGVFFDLRSNNVMFSLALALLTIWMVDVIRHQWRSRPAICWIVFSLLLVAVMSLVAMNTSVDYEQYAIIVAYLFYLFRRIPPLAAGLGYLSMLKEVWSFTGFSLTLTYNGERGRQIKLLNYCFYPGHLLIIGTIRMLLGH